MLTSAVEAAISSRRLVFVLVFLAALGGLAICRAEPSYAAPRGCVIRDFSRSEHFMYEPCVVDVQGMLNNLARHQAIWNPPPSPQLNLLAPDGLYGQNTYDDVRTLNKLLDVTDNPPGHDGRATPQTWFKLCLTVLDVTNHAGDDYVNAGCPTEPGLPGPERSSRAL
jgi:hypothetical protein